MKITKPKTWQGKLSIVLNVIFITVIIISVMLVNVLGVLSYDDTWWDVTVNVFVLSFAAMVFGTLAIRKGDDCLLVNISVWVSGFAVLFIITHSLFISD